MGIWETIVLGLKGSIYFLEKNMHISLDIYINQILERLKFPFYNQCLK